MGFNPSRLRAQELSAGAGAIVLLAISFLPWYGVQLETRGRSLSLPGASDAWSSFSLIDLLLALTIVLALAACFLQATRRAPALPTSFLVLTIVVSAITALLVLIRILAPPGVGGSALAPGGSLGAPAGQLSHTVQLGAYLGLLSLLVILACAWRALRREGMFVGDEEPVTETVTIGAAAAGDPVGP